MENSQGVLHEKNALKKSIKEVYKNISLQKNQYTVLLQEQRNPK